MGFKVLAAQPADNEPAPASINGLVGLSGAPLSESVGNCVSSFLARPGQGLQAVGAGLQAVGAVGGLFQGATSSFPASLMTPAAVGAELAGQLRTEFYAEQSSVLFVVDDFRGGVDLPDGLSAADTDLDALAPTISHGALVLHHVLELVPTALPWMSGPVEHAGPGGQPYYEFTSGYEGHLYVQVIDVGDMDTDGIPAKILTGIAAYGDDEFKAYNMYVNMSFAIVPCSVLEDYRSASQLPTFEAYVDALAAVNRIGDQYQPALEELVSTPVRVSDDPLLSYLACPIPATREGSPVCDGSGPGEDDWGPFDRLVHVAASGNYGNDYALYPAASTSVVSVGSLERAGAGYLAAGYSNAAQVAAPGGLFVLSQEGGRTIAYAGTSFAAPEVALFLAIDSMSYNPGTLCGRWNKGPGGDLKLASGDYDMVPFYSTDPADANTALVEYCLGPG